VERNSRHDRQHYRPIAPLDEVKSAILRRLEVLF
jgi:hypothetical protein